MFDKTKYDNKYIKENYDRINLNVPKGDKDKIKKHAKLKGYDNITEYIKSLIYQDMAGGALRRGFEGFAPSTPNQDFLSVHRKATRCALRKSILPPT